MISPEGPIYVLSNTQISVMGPINPNQYGKLSVVIDYFPSKGLGSFRPFDVTKLRHRQVILSEFGTGQVLRCISWRSEQTAQSLFKGMQEQVTVSFENIPDEDISEDTPNRQEVLARGLWLLTIRRNT